MAFKSTRTKGRGHSPPKGSGSTPFLTLAGTTSITAAGEPQPDRCALIGSVDQTLAASGERVLEREKRALLPTALPSKLHAMYPSLALLLLALVVPLASGDSVSVRNSSYNEGLLGRAPTQKFSSSTLLPPQFNLLTPRLNDSGLYTFLGYRGNDAKQLAPIIMDDSGSLVWTGPEYGSVLNVQAQTYQGEPVISFYTGTEMFPGFGRGQVSGSRRGLRRRC